MRNLGERLTYIRKQRGYTQDALAETIGVSRGVIFNLEKNLTEPQRIVINALCQTLCINSDWLLTGEGEMERSSENPPLSRALTELYELSKSLSEEEQLFVLDVIKAMKKRFHEKNKAK